MLVPSVCLFACLTRLLGKAPVTRIDDIVSPDKRLTPRGRGRQYGVSATTRLRFSGRLHQFWNPC